MTADGPTEPPRDGGSTGRPAESPGEREPSPDRPTEASVGERRERATLSVVEPAIARGEVESEGRVGAVAYPYRIYEAVVTMDRPLIGPRTARYVASVDRSRRLVVRGDVLPETEHRSVDDVLVIPSELTDEEAAIKARDAAFRWTLRTYSPLRAPEVDLESRVDGYRLFWLAERNGGDVVVDSVRGAERRLDG